MIFKKHLILPLLFAVCMRVNSQTSCFSFSTYFGGNQFDEIKGVCEDLDKNSYIIGNTYSANMPITLGLINDTASGNYDVFLAKIDSCGGLVWCTYFGTPNFDSGEKIKLSHDGNIVFCGYSSGTNLPTTAGCFQPSNHGGYDCFLTKITPNGTIIWNTYFGKSNGDFAYDITTDALDNIVIGGTTNSTNLYTTAASFQQNFKGNTDAFIARFNKNGLLKWCTYYGGNNNEDIHALAIDKDYNIIGAGGSFSSNLNTSVGAYQTLNDGGSDVYLLKLDSNCVRVFSSYLGGTGVDDAWGVTVDSLNTIYLAGHTTSFDFDTTAFAYQTIKQGTLSDWYLSKWSSTGTLLTSTLFGGLNNDLLSRMVFDSQHNLMLVGKSESTDMPIFGTNNQASNAGNYDVFLAQFNPTTLFPIWTSYYGGEAEEDPTDIVCNAAITFAGSTNSTGYPYQSSLNMSNDGMMTKLKLPNLTPTYIKENSLAAFVPLFPNPFNTVINVDLPYPFSIEFKTVLGQSVYFEKNKKTVDTQALPVGIYFITIKTNNLSETYKLIKN
jgi:hypothetical protein